MKDKKTRVIREQTDRSQNREHSTPVYLTSSFTFDDAEQARALFADEIEGNIYSRFTNPNVSELISKLVLLENTEDGFAFARQVWQRSLLHLEPSCVQETIYSVHALFSDQHTRY